MKAGRPKYRVKARYITVQLSKDEQVCFDLKKTGELKKTRGKLIPKPSNMQTSQQSEVSIDETNERVLPNSQQDHDNGSFDFGFPEEQFLFQEENLNPKADAFDEFI